MSSEKDSHNTVVTIDIERKLTECEMKANKTKKEKLQTLTEFSLLFNLYDFTLSDLYVICTLFTVYLY